MSKEVDLTRDTRACVLLLTLILALALTGCNSPQPAPSLTVRTVVRTPSPASQATSAPAGASQAESPLPAPGAGDMQAAQSPLPTPLPTVEVPTAGNGAVHGVLMTSNDHKPYQATLYLGRAIPPSDPKYGPMIGFSENVDPKAETDPTSGYFQFKDIPPGTYTLIIWTPVGSTAIEKPGTKEYLLFDVKVGEVTDLGEVLIQ
jgi:hypothetical protein